MLGLFKNHFELLVLVIQRSVRINMSIEKTQTLVSELNRNSHSDARPPRAFVPRQVDSRYVRYPHPAEQCHSCIARIVDRNLLFKIQPPLALLWFDATRDSGRDMNVFEAKLGGQTRRYVTATGASGLFVCFLEC